MAIIGIKKEVHKELQDQYSRLDRDYNNLASNARQLKAVNENLTKDLEKFRANLNQYSLENRQLKEEISNLRKREAGLRNAINKWKTKALNRSSDDKVNRKVIEVQKRWEYNKDKGKNMWRTYTTHQVDNIKFGFEDIDRVTEHVKDQAPPGSELVDLKIRGDKCLFKYATWD